MILLSQKGWRNILDYALYRHIWQLTIYEIQSIKSCKTVINLILLQRRHAQLVQSVANRPDLHGLLLPNWRYLWSHSQVIRRSHHSACLSISLLPLSMSVHCYDWIGFHDSGNCVGKVHRSALSHRLQSGD